MQLEPHELEDTPDEPEGSAAARLVGFVLLLAVPISVLGLFVVGGSHDCAVSSNALVCSSPDTWILLSMAHAAALVTILALAVVGTYLLIKRGVPPLAWARAWGVAAVVVSMVIWWICTW